MKQIHIFFFSILFFCANQVMLAQKKVSLQSLDQIKGLFFVPNTPTPFEGLATEEYPDGTKVSEVPIKAGKIDGVVREYSRTGVKSSEVSYQKGIKNGPELQWHDSGKKKLQVNNLDGKAEGICTEWHPNGKKKSEGNFKQGREQGEQLWWHANGKPDQKAVYTDGLVQGTLQQWYDNGQLRMESEFKNGKRNGLVTEWYEMGLKKSEGNFLEDKENGTLRNWARNGQLIGVREYESGKIIREENYQSGSVRTEKGYVEIFNEPESTFSVRIESENVKSRKADAPTYVIDGRIVVQLLAQPLEKKTYFKKGETDISLLHSFQQEEIEFIQNVTATKKLEVETSDGTTKLGKSFVYWFFTPPNLQKEVAKTPKTIVREDYCSIVCGKYVLSLYGLTTGGNSPDETKKVLQKIVETVRIYEQKIDLNKKNWE